MKVATIVVALMVTSWVPEITCQIPSQPYFLARQNQRRGHYRIRRQTSADQMVQNILQWLQGVYTQSSRKIRQGTIREYLPPSNTQKPRPFEPAIPTGRPEDNTIGYPTAPPGVFPPTGGQTPAYEYSPPSVQITVTSQTEAPQQPDQTQLTPTGFTPQETPQQPGYPQETPQQPGYQQETPQQPGYPQETPQQPGYPQETPQQPGYPQETPQQPGYPQETPQQPGYPQETPQQPGLPQETPQQPEYPKPTSQQPEQPTYPQPSEEPGYPSEKPEEPLPFPTQKPGERPEGPPSPGYPELPGEPHIPETTERQGYPPAGETPRPPFELPGFPEQPKKPEEGPVEPPPSYPGAETPQEPEGTGYPTVGPQPTPSFPGYTEKPVEQPTESTGPAETVRPEEPVVNPVEEVPKQPEQYPGQPEQYPGQPEQKPEVSGQQPELPGQQPEVPEEQPVFPEQQPVIPEQGGEQQENGSENEAYTSGPVIPTTKQPQLVPGEVITSVPQLVHTEEAETTKQPTEPAQPETPKPEVPQPGETPSATPYQPTEEDLKHPPHIHALDVICDTDKMTITVEFNRQFDGIVYSKGHHTQQNCRYVTENSGQTKYEFTVFLNQCGTELVNTGTGEDKSYLENVLVMQNEAGIQEIWDTVRAVRCQWEQSLKKSLTASLSVGMLNQEIVTFSGDSIMARLDIQKGEGPHAPTATGLVPIGEKMTLVVSVTGASDYDIQVKDCKAKDSESQNEVSLTDGNGCVLKPKLFGAFQKTREDNAVLAYAFFNAFKFPDIMDLMIECNVELCKGDCDICQEPNQKIQPGKRRKRQANGTLSDPITVGKLLRVLLPEDLSNGEAIIKVEHQGVCMSIATFFISTSLMISLLVAATLFSAYSYIKTQRFAHKL